MENATQILQFESIDESLINLLGLINEHGDAVSPRGLPTRELLNVSFKLTNPRARLVHNEARRWSLPLAVGEFLWHFAGSRDEPVISYYAPRWADYSEGRVIPSSCYGYKMFSPVGGGPSRWDITTDLLRSDPCTRRAVIDLYHAGENSRLDAVDVACCSTLQFIVRDGRLNLTVYMRSNDAIWGLPYDCFVFTMLQELLAHQLGYALGEYVHFAASLHVYERHFALVDTILSAAGEAEGLSMPPMPSTMPKDALLSYEEQIREQGPVLSFDGLPTYWGNLLLVLSFHKAYRLGNESLQHAILEEVDEPAYERLLKTSLLSATR